jgi:uncharacterized protein (DUF488 family)
MERHDVNCAQSHLIHSIGHSTRAIEAFLGLLKAHSIQLLIDVRRWPASRRYPHFHREALSDSLRVAGVEYVWRGDLGGFRKPSRDSPNTAWRVGAFRAYADFMLTAEFEKIITQMERVAQEKRVALMCAEAVPWRCHRQLLADAFLVRAAGRCDISSTMVATSMSCPLSPSHKGGRSTILGLENESPQAN